MKRLIFASALALGAAAAATAQTLEDLKND